MLLRVARSLTAAGLLASGLLVAGSAFGAPPILRFETTQPGNVIATGNTLGLSKQAGLNGPGTQDAIGTFITLDTASVDDTPAMFEPTGGCPIGKDTCPAPGLDPIHNYMDYSFDSCYEEFTPDQTARMQAQYLHWRVKRDS